MMQNKPFFIRNPIESIYYGGDLYINKPVNLNLCKSLRKTKIQYYPDNVGRPGIEFEGCDVKWMYASMEERDLDLKKLSINHFDKFTTL